MDMHVRLDPLLITRCSQTRNAFKH